MALTCGHIVVQQHSECCMRAPVWTTANRNHRKFKHEKYQSVQESRHQQSSVSHYSTRMQLHTTYYTSLRSHRIVSHSHRRARSIYYYVMHFKTINLQTISLFLPRTHCLCLRLLCAEQTERAADFQMHYRLHRLNSIYIRFFSFFALLLLWSERDSCLPFLLAAGQRLLLSFSLFKCIRNFLCWNKWIIVIFYPLVEETAGTE